MANQEAVVLIGHGGVPKDVPGELIAELKRLEAARERSGEIPMTPREAELDRRVRHWPRTAETDPYRAGLEAVAGRLRARIRPRRLMVAYNEFCAPRVEDAVDTLVTEGCTRVVLVSTMFTPGGSHSEREIPKLVTLLRARHPGTEIDYAWPFDLDLVADFLAQHIERCRK